MLITGQGARLSDNDNVFGGDLIIDGGSLDMNDATGFSNPAGLTVNGDLRIQNGGNLGIMLGEILEVLGSATFAGSDEKDSLTSGTLRLHGNFTQSANSLAFAVGSGFTVELHGTGATGQTISFANPGYAASHFGALLDSTTTGAVTLNSDVYVLGSVATPGGVTTRSVKGNGHKLFANAASLGSLTFDNAPLEVDYDAAQATLLNMTNVTFANMDPTADQLTVKRPNGIVALNGLTFSSAPTSGVYLNAVDVLADVSPLTIQMLSPTPGTSSGFVRTTAGLEAATVLWPYP